MRPPVGHRLADGLLNGMRPMSNGVFNFNLLALLLSEILGEYQIYTRGPCAPCTPPSVNFFVPEASTSHEYCGVFNFNILALVVFEILGGPKFTLGGPVPPCVPPSGNFFVPEASNLLCLKAFLISTF